MSYGKIQGLLNSCALEVFNPEDIIFDIDSKSSNFYVLQKGVVELQIVISIEKVNKWPVGTKSWNIRQIFW